MVFGSNKFKFAAVIIVLLSLISMSVQGADKKGSFDFLDQQKINSHLIADIFMQNVDQGKIDIFGHILKRSELEQENVAYIHNLKDDTVSICIRIKVKDKLPVPNFENYYVEAISVDIDPRGRIDQVRTHILPIRK